jgi:chromosome segregation ATPase
MSKNIYLESETSEMSNDAVVDEYKDILQKNLQLTIELDDSRRLLKDREFELTTQIKTLSNESENLKKTVQSFTELVEYYKQQDNKKSDSVILDFQARNTELSNKVSELDNKLLMTEQREYNLKREVISLNSSIGELRMEVEKKNTAIYTEEEVKDLFSELEELRKENADISERALNMLTEKEMQLIQMKEEVDGLKAGMCKKEEEIAGLKEDLHVKPLETSTFYEHRRESLQRRMDTEVTELRREYMMKTNEWNQERDGLNRIIEDLEERLRNQQEEHDKEMDDYKSLAGDRKDSNAYTKEQDYDEIEHYNNLIHNLEQKNEETSNYYKAQIKVLRDEMNDIDKLNTTYHQQIEMLNKELADIKLEGNKKLTNIQERQKFELTARDKDIQFFKSKIEGLERDKELLRKDLESSKAFNEKSKEDYLSLMDQLNRIKENHDIEKNKLEDKIVHLESFGDVTINQDVSVLEKSIIRKPTLNNIFSMNETFDNEMDKSKISHLENEVKLLNTKLKQKDTQNSNIFRLNSEIQHLNKEKLKIKEEMANMKEMYELQIKDLLVKLQAATEKPPQIIETYNPVETIELEEKVNNFKAENKFLNEQIEILKGEVKGVTGIKDSVIKKQKDELEEFQLIAANAKVSLAQVVFEKDSEIMKFKMKIKKLRAKSSLSMSTFSSEKDIPTPNSKTSFFKKMFK